MYKILVISDTHRRISTAIDLIQQITDLDHVFHLGDLVSDAQDLESFLDIPIHYVTGNCDYYSIAAPSSRVVEVLGKRFFLTHGHNHGVKFSLDHLRFLANEEGYDCILFGHTHIPLMEYEGDTLIMNPGSISLPRNSDYPTFAIIQIDDKACIHGTLEEFKKKLLKKC